MNDLFPIFLKTHQLQILIVGGGYVALEKLQFLFKSSPQSQVTIVAPFFRDETFSFIQNKNIHIINDSYNISHLTNKQIVIATTDKNDINFQIYNDCRSLGILVNVADTPTLCDFYLGSIVTKGNLKIGISTNGKSPTLAKRLREWLEDVIPNEINESLENLYNYRKRLKNDFSQKVKAMNEITKGIIEKGI